MNGKKAKKIRKMTRDAMVKHGREEKHFGFYCNKTKKLVRAGILTVCAMLLVNISYADKIGVLDIDPIVFQERLAEKGFKLDFTIREKTSDSWGVLGHDDVGMCVNTYKPVNIDNLSIITQAMWDSMEELNDG